MPPGNRTTSRPTGREVRSSRGSTRLRDPDAGASRSRARAALTGGPGPVLRPLAGGAGAARSSGSQPWPGSLWIDLGGAWPAHRVRYGDGSIPQPVRRLNGARAAPVWRAPATCGVPGHRTGPTGIYPPVRRPSVAAAVSSRPAVGAMLPAARLSRCRSDRQRAIALRVSAPETGTPPYASRP
jgi:hypothetical protein